MSFKFVNQGHLGGYIASTPEHPNGDPATYCPELWQHLISTYLLPVHPRPMVLDLGCGEGHSSAYFEKHGCMAYPVDGLPSFASRFPPSLQKRFAVHDFTTGPMPKPDNWPPAFELAWCCEFVEHIDAQHEDNFLELLAKADVIAMTHAFPGQVGHHHVNCQPPDYWLSRLEERGFSVDYDAAQAARNLAPNTHFARSGLLLVRKGSRWDKRLSAKKEEPEPVAPLLPAGVEKIADRVDFDDDALVPPDLKFGLEDDTGY